MKQLRLIAFLPALMLLFGAAPAHRSGAAHGRTIPFHYEDSRIYVPVRIAGGPPRWFILDTGATGTIIDSAAAKAEGLSVSGVETVHGAGSGGSTQGRTSAVDLKVGPVPLQVDNPLVMDLAHLLGPTSGRAPAGIIGAQFFREHFVDVDFPSHHLNAFPPGIDRRNSYAAAVPLTFAEGLPLTAVELTVPNGRTVTAKAVVDLGAKSTFLIPEPFIDRQKLRAVFPNSVESQLGAGVGGDTFYAFARADRLGFADTSMSIDKPVVGLSVRGTLRSTWHEGLLGADFLSRFRIGFDFAHRRLLLIQRSRQPAPFDRSGAFLIAEDGNTRSIVVRNVLEGSPAAQAGLLPGDEILAVGGASVRSMSLPAVRDLLKRRDGADVTLTYRRGATQGKAQIRLRDLL